MSFASAFFYGCLLVATASGKSFLDAKYEDIAGQVRARRATDAEEVDPAIAESAVEVVANAKIGHIDTSKHNDHGLNDQLDEVLGMLVEGREIYSNIKNALDKSTGKADTLRQAHETHKTLNGGKVSEDLAADHKAQTDRKEEYAKMLEVQRANMDDANNHLAILYGRQIELFSEYQRNGIADGSITSQELDTSVKSAVDYLRAKTSDESINQGISKNAGYIGIMMALRSTLEKLQTELDVLSKDKAGTSEQGESANSKGEKLTERDIQVRFLLGELDAKVEENRKANAKEMEELRHKHIRGTMNSQTALLKSRFTGNKQLFSAYHTNSTAIDGLKEDQETERKAMLAKQKSACESHAAQVAALGTKYKQQEDEMIKDHAKEVKEMNAKIAKQEKEHQNEVATIKAAKDAELAKMKKAHKGEMDSRDRKNAELYELQMANFKKFNDAKAVMDAAIKDFDKVYKEIQENGGLPFTETTVPKRKAVLTCILNFAFRGGFGAEQTDKSIMQVLVLKVRSLFAYMGLMKKPKNVSFAAMQPNSAIANGGVHISSA